MLGIRYAKAGPTTYVLHYQGGAVRREGTGLSFLYFAPVSSLVMVPLHSQDLPFVFRETTADFQEVSIQGQLSFRVSEPRRLASLLDFSVGPAGTPEGDGPELLGLRLVQTTQVLTRSVVLKLPLQEALVSLDELVAKVRAGLAEEPGTRELGVEILGVAIQSIKPTPEMAKALEARAREALQRRADEAVYERRNAAVEQERLIRESELNTEIAVEEKQREIRERHMAADVSVEERRAALIERKAANDRKTADSQAYALEASLKHVKGLDWRMLMALASGGGDPRLMIAAAFRDLAENAGKIGELHISPELLGSLLKGGGK